MTRIVVWDLETTGLNPYHDQIIEIAALDNYGNAFETLICLEPGKLLSGKIQELTGITSEMLVGQSTLEQALLNFLTFIEGADYLIGHNSIRFDSLFLSSALRKCGQVPVKIRQIDTMLMCQYYYGHINSFALSSLCKYFRIQQNNAHRAMADVKATFKLFNAVSKDKCITPDQVYDLGDR